MNGIRPQPDADLPPGITPEQGELLSAYLDGELAGTDLARAEKLLTDSPAARTWYTQLAELTEDLSLFKTDQSRLSPEVARKVLTQWQAGSVFRPVRRPLVRWLASAAAAAAIAGGFFLLNRPPAQPPATPSLGGPLAAAPTEALRRNRPETNGPQWAFADQRGNSNLNKIPERQSPPPAPAAPFPRPEVLQKSQAVDQLKNATGEPKPGEALPLLAMTAGAPRPEAGIRRLKVHVNPGDPQKLARLDAELNRYRTVSADVRRGTNADRELAMNLTGNDLSPTAQPAPAGGAAAAPAKGPAPLVAKEETRQIPRGQARTYTLRMTAREANELEHRLASYEPQDRLGGKLAAGTRDSAKAGAGAGQGIAPAQARKAGTDKGDQDRKEEQLEAKDAADRTNPTGEGGKPKVAADQLIREKAKDQPRAEAQGGDRGENAGAKPFGGTLKNAPSLAEVSATQPRPTNRREQAPGLAGAPAAQAPPRAASSQPTETEEMVTVIIELVPIADNQQP